jgi:tetratricopeptide (TPR) repeat protein
VDNITRGVHESRREIIDLMPKLTIPQAFELAMQHHKAGRLREAEAVYRQILSQRPRSADALHLLGLIAHQAGRHESAIDLIGRALALTPKLSAAHNNLGSALRSHGQIDEAIAAYRRAIALRPDYASALYNLGSLLKDKGEFDEAIDACRRAIALQPDFSEAHNNLGNALSANGQLEEAIAAYQNAVAIRPQFAEAHNNLGITFRENGQLDEAITAFRGAIAQKPGFAEAHSNLGNALRNKGQFEQAIAEYRKAVELGPNVAKAHLNLGITLKENGQLNDAIASFSKAIELQPDWATPHLLMGDLLNEQGQHRAASAAFARAALCEPKNAVAHGSLAAMLAELHRLDEARESLDRAEALDPDSALTHYARGIILLRGGRGTEAVESFRRVVEIEPESAAYWNCLGETLRHVGRFDEAAECFRQILALRPGEVRAYNLMATLGATADDAEMARLAAAFNDPQTPTADRAGFGFILGKMLDGKDRFDEAFAHYAAANSLTLQMRRAAGNDYSAEVFARRVDDLIALSTPEFFHRTRGWGEDSEVPVFIVGMPRSGTSLVEQIASSHPDVFGAGELMDISNIATALVSGEWQPEAIKHAARKQLDRLRALGGAALRVIDKMPDNVERLGLIATLFPTARVILCRRDPRDTCLSCFFQRFMAGNLFSFDLAQCGFHQVQTDRLIAHWLNVLPLRMLEVQYEELVADLEGQSRRIIHFLDLPWNPACIDFHQTERTVQTASDWQVRQPIYTRSVGRWRKYEGHLGALLKALDSEGRARPVN